MEYDDPAPVEEGGRRVERITLVMAGAALLVVAGLLAWLLLWA
jgi:hypothetical protein